LCNFTEEEKEGGCLSKANPENLVPTTDLELHHSPQENNCITNILTLQMLCTGKIQHMKPIFKKYIFGLSKRSSTPPSIFFTGQNP